MGVALFYVGELHPRPLCGRLRSVRSFCAARPPPCDAAAHCPLSRAPGHGEQDQRLPRTCSFFVETDVGSIVLVTSPVLN